MENRWYFIELYHLNNTKENLILYIDKRLVQNFSFKQYTHMVKYVNNSIGNSITSDIKTKDEFYGEMTALYFLEANVKSYEAIHNFFVYAYDHRITNNLLIWGESDADIIEKIFIYIHPNCIEPMKNLYSLRKGKNSIISSISQLGEKTMIAHCIKAKNSFIYIGGLKCILPILHKAIKYSKDNKFLYCLSKNRNSIVMRVMNICELALKLSSDRKSVV